MHTFEVLTIVPIYILGFWLMKTVTSSRDHSLISQKFSFWLVACQTIVLLWFC